MKNYLNCEYTDQERFKREVLWRIVIKQITKTN